ncbi:MAG: hypothetical protein RI940_1692 [Bacteroidota bacterium]|jgi:hypothetical protein
MKPIERIAIYLQFKTISPHSFERNINLSNGYYAKQLKNLGSVGSDILIKVHNHYPDLNILWVLTGDGQMIAESDSNGSISNNEDYPMRYISDNKKLKLLESDLEKLNVVIKDKEKIIGLYEFMLNNNQQTTTIADMR